MIDLYESESGTLIGPITEPELQLLADTLEQEPGTEHEYYIDAVTISLIGDGRATEHLLHLLWQALGTRDGVDIQWERKIGRAHV